MADDLRFMQLFFNDRELKPTPHAVNGTVYDECSLDDLYMGAGTTLYGYDLSETPDYWPKRYNAAKETLEYLPEFEPPKKKEPVAQMMPEVEPLQGPSLYSRSRAIYTTELDSAQQRSQPSWRSGRTRQGSTKPRPAAGPRWRAPSSSRCTTWTGARSSCWGLGRPSTLSRRSGWPSGWP